MKYVHTYLKEKRSRKHDKGYHFKSISLSGKSLRIRIFKESTTFRTS